MDKASELMLEIGIKALVRAETIKFINDCQGKDAKGASRELKKLDARIFKKIKIIVQKEWKAVMKIVELAIKQNT